MKGAARGLRPLFPSEKEISRSASPWDQKMDIGRLPSQRTRSSGLGVLTNQRGPTQHVRPENSRGLFLALSP